MSSPADLPVAAPDPAETIRAWTVELRISGDSVTAGFIDRALDALLAERQQDAKRIDKLVEVCSRACVLLEALQPWSHHGPEVNTACARLTLALALVPALAVEEDARG